MLHSAHIETTGWDVDHYPCEDRSRKRYLGYPNDRGGCWIHGTDGKILASYWIRRLS